MARRIALTVVAAMLAFAPMLARAAAESVPDLELVRRARAALAQLKAFERLNAEIVKRCHEPVTGAYGDWRDEFRTDLERAHALDKALQQRAPDAATASTNDERLRPFTETEGQALYSQCLRWSTLLIQHESPARAELSAVFAFLKDNESRLRMLIGDEAVWREWRAAGAVP